MKQSTKSEPKPKLKPTHSFNFEAIGTLWSIEIYQPLSDELAYNLERTILERINTFDKNYSRFRPDSMISKMAQTAGTYSLPADAKKLFDTYKDLYEISDGAVTPMVGQLLSDAGYDSTYSFKPKKLNSPPAWDEVLDYDYPLLTLKTPKLLDFGAAGKGYLVDIIAALLKRSGVKSFCVDAGGDISYQNPELSYLSVGLEHPDNPGQVIGVANILNQSICGSAGNRRAWAGFTHIIDPSSKRSPEHLKAVWVSADTTLLADALTTALYFVPPAKLLKRYNFEYALLYSDYSLQSSNGFRATIFSA